MSRPNRRVMFNLQKQIMTQDLEMELLHEMPPHGYKILYSGYYYGKMMVAKNQSSLVCVNVSKKRSVARVVGFGRILRYLCCMSFADDDVLDSSYGIEMQYKITVEIFTSKMQQLIYEVELLYAKGE